MNTKKLSAVSIVSAAIAFAVSLGLDVSAEESGALALGVGALVAVALRNWPTKPAAGPKP